MEDWQSGRMQEFAKFQVGEIRPIGSNPISSAKCVATDLRESSLASARMTKIGAKFKNFGEFRSIRNVVAYW